MRSYYSGYLAAALACSGVTAVPTASLEAASQLEQHQRLAVVVPAYVGDLDRAVSSLGRWPSTCSPLTQENVDLVLYYAEGEADAAAVDAAAAVVAETAGRCFSKTLTVYAHLNEEEDVYPKGPSVMFYKMFLDEGVRANLSEYDALAILEWDVLVASDKSFEELYHAAFRVNEDFWVKGSNLEGTNFHQSSTFNDMWHVMGHINGNAIYNNNDPRFVEFVDYTRTRWEYEYPYDVALWLTIADFPYSWPLYQRFSPKFVTTNLIAYVGYEHVDHTTVTDAIAGQTLFIHGKNVDEGSNKSVEETKKVHHAAPAKKETAADRAAAAEKAKADTDRFVDATAQRQLQSEPDRRQPSDSEKENARVARKLRKWSAKNNEEEEEEEAGATRQLQTDPYRRQLSDTEKESARIARKLQKWSAKNTEEEEEEEEGAGATRQLQTDPYRRQLSDSEKESARVARKLQKWKTNNAEEEAEATRQLQTDPYRRKLSSTEKESARVARKLQKWSAKNTEEEEEAEATRQLQTDPYRRRLSSTEKESARVARKLQKWSAKNTEEEEEAGATRQLQTDPYRRRLSSTEKESARVARKLQKWSAKNTDEAEATRQLQTDPYRRRLSNTEQESARVARKLQKWSAKNTEEEEAEATRQLQTDPYRRRLTNTEQESARVARKLQKWSAKTSEDEDEEAEATRQLQTDPYRRRMSDSEQESARIARKLQKWSAKTEEEEEEAEATRQLQTDPYRRQLSDTEQESARVGRKLQQLEKSQEGRRLAAVEQSPCLEGCEYTSKDGKKGRVCDDSCETGEPFGLRGCEAKSGKYGPHCRACYRDVELALEMADDDEEHPAIMCDTFAPVDRNAPRLPDAASELSAEQAEVVAQFFEDEAKRAFIGDVTRGNICAFVAGTASQVDQLEVTVTSVLEFRPGVRVAVAAEHDALDAYRRTVGELPGVSVSGTSDALSASLFADEYCGEGTSLIHYIKLGSVVSRAFTSKDTHSPHGDLLVVYGKENTAHHGVLAGRTAAVLGFEAPSFTTGTDLILPVEANADLRAALAAGGDAAAALAAINGVLKLGDLSAVPQMLAALQYKRATPGMWFFNPQEWLTKHLFQAASIWDIPLVKPRFTCEIYPSGSVPEADVAGVLRRNLDFFAMGGTCEGGTIITQA